MNKNSLQFQIENRGNGKQGKLMYRGGFFVKATGGRKNAKSMQYICEYHRKPPHDCNASITLKEGNIIIRQPHSVECLDRRTNLIKFLLSGPETSLLFNDVLRKKRRRIRKITAKKMFTEKQVQKSENCKIEDVVHESLDETALETADHLEVPMIKAETVSALSIMQQKKKKSSLLKQKCEMSCQTDFHVEYCDDPALQALLSSPAVVLSFPVQMS